MPKAAAPAAFVVLGVRSYAPGLRAVSRAPVPDRGVSPSARSANGAVSPWTMTENATTPKAEMRISSRSGRSAGSDSAS